MMMTRKQKKAKSVVAPKRQPPADWADRFLKALANTANVRASCQVAGVSRSHAYQHRKADEAFRAAWDEALEDACDVLEAIARKRATEGAKPSDLLLIFLLRAHRPEKYRESHKHEHSHEHSGPGGGPIVIKCVEVALPPDDGDHAGRPTAVQLPSGPGEGVAQ